MKKYNYYEDENEQLLTEKELKAHFETSSELEEERKYNDVEGWIADLVKSGILVEEK